MVNSDEYYEKIYSETLFVYEQREKYDEIEIDSVQRELDALYIYEGQDIEGRGHYKRLELEAQIAATQAFIGDYTKRHNLKS